MTPTKRQVVLEIPDMHAPYMHPEYHKFLALVKKTYAPTIVICGGDALDNHAVSYHEPDPDLYSPGHELKAAIKQLRPVYKLFPKVILLESNHGSLYKRKNKTGGLPASVLRSEIDIMEAPKGWKLYDEYVLKTPQGPVYYCHGKTATPGKLSRSMGMSTVQFHFHTNAFVFYWATLSGRRFDKIVGCAIDTKSSAFSYAKGNVQTPLLNVGIMIDGTPHLVPFLMDSKGRWTGKL